MFLLIQMILCPIYIADHTKRAAKELYPTIGPLDIDRRGRVENTHVFIYSLLLDSQNR